MDQSPQSAPTTPPEQTPPTQPAEPNLPPMPPVEPSPLPAQPAAPAVTPPAADGSPPLIMPGQPPPTPPPPPAEPPEEKKSWFKIILLGAINWILVPVLIVFILHNFVFQAFHVIGTSMVPTLHDTDYLIISKVGATESGVARAFGKDSPYIPKRDQIIVFHYPQDPTLVFVKRVIGLPGDRVTVKNGQVTVYNQEHPNGFNPDTGTDRTQNPTLGDIDEVVPKDNVFVLGDNRTPNGSYDSRDWGFLPYHYIIGEAVVRLLPVNQAGLL